MPNPNFLETLLTVPLCPGRTSRRKQTTGEFPLLCYPAQSPEPFLPRQITTAHDVQGGAGDWGMVDIGAFHFFPSPVQENEGVMMYLEKNKIADL